MNNILKIHTPYLVKLRPKIFRIFKATYFVTQNNQAHIFLKTFTTDASDFALGAVFSQEN